MEINFIAINRPPEVHWRMGIHGEFDAAEMSLGSFVAGKARGDFPFVGIPAFVYRKFRHSCAYVNADAGIDRPEDLKGKRIGVPEWQMTATVWLRGFLQDDYGVRPQDARWFTGGLESSGRAEKVPLQLPPDIRVETIPRAKSRRHAGCRRNRRAAHGAGSGALCQARAANSPAVCQSAQGRSGSFPPHGHLPHHARHGDSRRVIPAASLDRPESL
jgi:hypothetical protein